MKIFGVNIGRPGKLAARLVEATNTDLTPVIKPISRTFTVQAGPSGEPIRYTLAVIDSLHRDGVIPPLIAKQEVIDRYNGKFVEGRGILINPKSQIPEFTTAHEMGHVLDFYGFTRDRYESLHGREIAPVMDAWLATQPYRALQTLRTQLLQPLTSRDDENRRKMELERVNYLLGTEEVWSRAYAQWVATSSQDAVLLQQLEVLRQNPNYARFCVQWNDSDFTRLGQEIGLLFKRKGWLR